MKLNKHQLRLILEIIHGIDDSKITPEIDDLITDIHAIFDAPKPPKYFPIETAPIGVDILVWQSEYKIWRIWRTKKNENIRTAISGYTHWRPMPKGPK